MPSRGGSSRRWWWLAAIVAACVAAGWQAGAPRHTDPASAAAGAALRPALAGLSAAGRGLGIAWWNLTHLRVLGRRQAALAAESARLRAAAAEADELRGEVGRLRGLLTLQGEVKLPTVAARCIGRSPSSFFHTLMLNVGSSRGVREGCAVLAPGGLVGQVWKVSGPSCQVLCLTDRLGSAGARLQPARVRQVVGVARGDGGRLCGLAYADPELDVRLEDTVVTSGQEHGSLFPPGLIIGRVVAVERRPHESAVQLSIRPAVLPDEVEEVLVVLPPAGGPR